MAAANTTEDDGRGGGGLLARAGYGDEGGAGIRGSSPSHPAGGHGLVASLGARARAGGGRPTLVAPPEGGADGDGGLGQTGARGWCHGGG